MVSVCCLTLFHHILKKAWLAQLEEHQSTEWEVTGLNHDQANGQPTTGSYRVFMIMASNLLYTYFIILKLEETMVKSIRSKDI